MQRLPIRRPSSLKSAHSMDDEDDCGGGYFEIADTVDEPVDDRDEQDYWDSSTEE